MEDVWDATVSSSPSFHSRDSTQEVSDDVRLETKPSGNWEEEEMKGQGMEGCSCCSVCDQCIRPCSPRYSTPS